MGSYKYFQNLKAGYNIKITMEKEGPRSEPWLICLLLAIFLTFLVLSYFLPLLSLQEARRAVIIQETFLSKSLIPTFNGEPYFTKPPLHTYLSLPFYALGKLLSREIFFMRLLSLGSYLLSAYLVYLICQRDLKRTLLSLAILLSSFRFLSFIYRIDLEPPFVFFTTLSFYFLMRYLDKPTSGMALAFYLGFALAFLIRGPLHFFLIPAFGLYALFSKRKPLLRLLFYPAGWGLFLILVLPWYLYGYLNFGLGVFKEFLKTDLSERLVSQKDPFYYYFKAFILNFFPFLLLLLPRLKFIWKENPHYLRAHPLALYFFSVFIPLLLLSFTGSKFDKYLLYLYPIASLWLAELLLQIYSCKFLLKVSSIILFLNFLVVTILTYLPFKDLETNTLLWIKNLDPQGSYIFYQQVHPLASYILQRPLSVLEDEAKAREALNKGHSILTPVELKPLRLHLVLPDPYKKGRYWYIYR